MYCNLVGLDQLDVGILVLMVLLISFRERFQLVCIQYFLAMPNSGQTEIQESTDPNFCGFLVPQKSRFSCTTYEASIVLIFLLIRSVKLV